MKKWIYKIRCAKKKSRSYRNLVEYQKRVYTSYTSNKDNDELFSKKIKKILDKLELY